MRILGSGQPAIACELTEDGMTDLRKYNVRSESSNSGVSFAAIALIGVMGLVGYGISSGFSKSSGPGSSQPVADNYPVASPAPPAARAKKPAAMATTAAPAAPASLGATTALPSAQLASVTPTGADVAERRRHAERKAQTSKPKVAASMSEGRPAKGSEGSEGSRGTESEVNDSAPTVDLETLRAFKSKM